MAEAMGNSPAMNAFYSDQDKVYLAGLLGGLGAALAGGDAKQIETANWAGSNAAANNYLTHRSLSARDADLKTCQASGDTACELRVLEKYDQLSAQNTGQLRRDSLLEKGSLEAIKADLQDLLTDSSVSVETKGQAQRSIREIDTALNVINKSPILRDAAELGLIAVDIATLGELALARTLTSAAVNELVLQRTGVRIGDAAAARIANNFYRDGNAMPQALATSSGIVIQATPGKTTTVLGTYVADTGGILERQLGLPESPDFTGPRVGGFNLLNVPDDVFISLGPDQFWQQVNKPFLDAAIKRGDEIFLATTPSVDATMRGGTLSGFGKEYQYLTEMGYQYEATTGRMIKR